MRISDLAREMGVSTQTVRDYESWGILPPVERTASGYRVYEERHRRVLLLLSDLRDAGYTKSECIGVMSAIHDERTGDALTIVDNHHARLSIRRTQLGEIEVALGKLMTSDNAATPSMTIGAMAASIGVQSSTLRYWEQERIIRSDRNPDNRYRVFNSHQIQLVRLVAFMRDLGFSYASIRKVTGELENISPEAVSIVLKQRCEDLDQASLACAKATAAIWSYINDFRLLNR